MSYTTADIYLDDCKSCLKNARGFLDDFNRELNEAQASRSFSNDGLGVIEKKLEGAKKEVLDAATAYQNARSTALDTPEARSLKKRSNFLLLYLLPPTLITVTLACVGVFLGW
ncbi:MAG: hypothetical protein AAF226_19825, partial [Verrucomicrobiota bacterium]